MLLSNHYCYKQNRRAEDESETTGSTLLKISFVLYLNCSQDMQQRQDNITIYFASVYTIIAFSQLEKSQLPC